MLRGSIWAIVASISAGLHGCSRPSPSCLDFSLKAFKSCPALQPCCSPNPLQTGLAPSAKHTLLCCLSQQLKQQAFCVLSSINLTLLTPARSNPHAPLPRSICPHSPIISSNPASSKPSFHALEPIGHYFPPIFPMTWWQSRQQRDRDTLLSPIMD